MIQKVNSLSSNVYTSHGEILKVFFFFFKYVDLPNYMCAKRIKFLMTRLSVCGLGVSCNEMNDTPMLLVVLCRSA